MIYRKKIYFFIKVEHMTHCLSVLRFRNQKTCAQEDKYVSYIHKSRGGLEVNGPPLIPDGAGSKPGRY